MAFRGEEVFKLVLGEARDYIAEARKNIKLPRVVLPLRKRFKGETGESFHFVMITVKSHSGLEIGPWLEKGIELQEKRGITIGYCFINEKGRLVRSKEFKVHILDRIVRIQLRYPELIRPGFKVHE